MPTHALNSRLYVKEERSDFIPISHPAQSTCNECNITANHKQISRRETRLILCMLGGKPLLMVHAHEELVEASLLSGG